MGLNRLIVDNGDLKGAELRFKNIINLVTVNSIKNTVAQEVALCLYSGVLKTLQIPFCTI
jgi:hypothetical protein